MRISLRQRLIHTARHSTHLLVHRTESRRDRVDPVVYSLVAVRHIRPGNMNPFVRQQGTPAGRHRAVEAATSLGMSESTQVSHDGSSENGQDIINVREYTFVYQIYSHQFDGYMWGDCGVGKVEK